MTLPITISRATSPEDFHQVATLENRVFYNTPFSSIAFGPQRGSDANIEERAKGLAKQGSVATEGGVTKVISRDENGEELIAGAAVWSFVVGRESEKSLQADDKNEGQEEKEEDGAGEKKGSGWGIGANVRFCEDVFLVADGHMVRSTKGRDYAKLAVLIVSPEHQRRGIGTRLLEAGLAGIDEMGLQCVLAASKEGLDLYKKFGFVEFEMMRLKLWKYEGGEEYKEEESHVVMRRPARGEKVDDRIALFLSSYDKQTWRKYSS
ncbi:uncharacterized protein RCO7_00855 [Rhynchosporium graminicola]|uniref:N-acetyltransferase domain-containing protein n=1 Tax=Rhynchosporium graminicola TaxID=2792576 RepID=A0A1E1JUE3_9HELO|nr:uncharacterized protein RCO7_00855 [Rhynchosporium commune]